MADVIRKHGVELASILIGVSILSLGVGVQRFLTLLGLGVWAASQALALREATNPGDRRMHAVVLGISLAILAVVVTLFLLN